jgi:hypothetical protein
VLELIDRAQTALKLETERPIALREAIMACKAGGIVSVPGVYGGLSNMIPMGAAMNKGLTLRTGQTHVKRWTDDLLRRIDEGEIDPTFVVTHTVPLGRGPEMYKTFREKKDGCIKVVLKRALRRARERGTIAEFRVDIVANATDLPREQAVPRGRIRGRRLESNQGEGRASDVCAKPLDDIELSHELFSTDEVVRE